jgi:subtilisin family serine protease
LALAWAWALAWALWLGVATAASAAAPVAAAVAERAARDQAVDVLVVLDDREQQRQLDSAVGTASTRRRADPVEYRRGVRARAQLLAGLKHDVLLAVADPDLETRADFDQLPVVQLTVRSNRALQRLRAHPRVKSVDAIRAVRSTLAQSLPLIGQPEVAAAGHVGAGTSVAVLDTGVDYTRAAFGACGSPGGSCKVAHVQDFATPDNALDTGSFHGTNVAGVVLGVAPGTRILGLDVFESNGLAYSNAILAAINWCIAHKATYNIAAINMSLGGGRHTAAIAPSDSFGVALTNAASAGIVVVVASGNDGYTDSISWPAAYANVVSVGAFHDAGASERQITGFSNSAAFLTMSAPGSMITAAGITMQGTSQAAPHVAGAAAVLRAMYESDTVPELVNRLKLGTPVVDTRNGVSVPGLELTAATATPPAAYRLTVSRAGSGTGTVVSTPSAIDCGSTCTALVGNGDGVLLTALQGAGAQFAGWTGACSGSTISCSLTMSATRSTTASFVPVAGEDFLPAGGLPRGWATASGAQAGWSGSTDSVFGGTHALKSAAVAHGESAGVSISGSFRSGMVSFARRVSAASGDGLSFLIDGQVQGSWTGEVAWGMVAFPITAGPHTLTWRYTKDGSGTAGSDAAWIDSVSLPHAATSAAGSRNDFNADGRADILWRHDGNGGNSLWLMDGAVRLGGSGSAPRTADTTWRVVGHADFDGDGRADILWRHVGNGSNALWTMDGIARLGSATLPRTADPAWIVAGIADFDGDGQVDILWRNGTTGDNALWLLNGTSRASAASLPRTADPAWQVVGAVDVDGDGKADVVWRNANTGANALWLMDGGSRRSAHTLPGTADTAWRVVVVTDFDGDGKADLLWRNVNTGANALWLMDGATRRSAHTLPTTADARWKIAAVGDFDGDGGPDLLWRHHGDGRNAMWTMNGATRTGTYTLPTAHDLNWRIVAPRTNPH